MFGLIGPNGAGKTTLIKVLCTLILATDEHAWVNGYSLSQEQLIKASVGLAVGGERNFYWRLSGHDNLIDLLGLQHGLVAVGGNVLSHPHLARRVRGFAQLLPITYALRAPRLALLQAASLALLALVPLGICAFHIAIRRVRRDGSLMQS